MAKKRVVIVGGGFAGLGCARVLAEHPEIEVTLLDKNNYHQFQPMFYQVATSQLCVDDLAYSLRKLFLESPQVIVKCAEAASVDPVGKTVATKFGDVFAGDYLVLAAGSQANFFKVPGAQDNTFPLYSLTDAERLRSRILQVYEEADRDPKRLGEGALNFVIVGAGPTGVEMAGALADLIRDTMSAEYPHLPKNAARIYLVDHGKQVLAAFSEKAHAYAANTLQASGIEIRLGLAVKEVGPGHVLLSDGSTIPTRLVIWAGGMSAAGLANRTGLPQGRGGRIDVQPDLTVAGFPQIYVLGDLANIPDGRGGFLPQLAAVALQAGHWAGVNILSDLVGKPRAPFEYLDKGLMAMINHGAAIAELGERRFELHGRLAVVAWLGVHAYLMTGVRNRIDALANWVWDHFSPTRGPQILDRSTTPRINWGDDAEEGLFPEAKP